MGGDCANYVSQCLIAGGLSLYEGTNGQGYGVYPDKDRSISSYGTIPFCDYLNTNLKNYQNAVATYITDTGAYVPSNIQVGDVVIFGDKNGDKYKHAMLVVSIGSNDCSLSAHSSNRWDYSFWNEISYFSCATFYHIPINTAGYYHFRVTASALNVRVGPGTNELGNNYEAIGVINNNEEYIAFDYAYDSQDRKWWHFWYDDRAAWCAEWYTMEVTGNSVFEVDVANYLNVRDGPSTSYGIVGQIYDKMRFVIHDISGDWLEFYHSGGLGYCHSSYVDIIEESTSQRVDGIDVSHWQGTINWNNVYADGYRFAFCKATEGITYDDPTFTTNMNSGTNAGVIMGAYHFAHPESNSATSEAAHFVSIINEYMTEGYLRPVLDLEDGYTLGRTALTNWVLSFMNYVVTQTGVEPLIYCNLDYASNYLDSRATVYDLWIARLVSSNPETGVWDDWTVWQYSWTGSVSGISGNVDLDYYNGNMQNLKENLEIDKINQLPIADAGPDKTVNVSDVITFDASGSYDIDGVIESYIWDFGDGSPSEKGISVSHTYTTNGSYIVSLHVIDDDDGVSIDYSEITVKPKLTPDKNNEDEDGENGLITFLTSPIGMIVIGVSGGIAIIGLTGIIRKKSSKSKRLKEIKRIEKLRGKH